jgi:alkylation response protein AidB-like acyl-CoA dehydrogenase
MRIAVVPRADVEIVDTWNVAGLRGTGSHEVAISDAIVPEALTSSPFFEPARHDGPLWRIPFYTLAGIFLAGFPLGVARRALDEFVAVAPTKSRLMAGETLAHDAAVQIEVARAEGMVDSARTLVLDALDDIWDKALFGDSPTLEQRARFLLAMQHAMFASTWAVDTVFRLAGAHAAYSSNPLQRCFRDIHIGAQHQFFSPGALNRYARLRFGIEQPTFMI